MNRRSRLLVLVVIALATAAVAVAHAAAPDASVPYDLSGTADQGVRPTAVGLPRIGQHGTIGAGDLAVPIIEYHDGGQYDKDVATVANAALAWTRKRANELLHPVGPKHFCKNRYVRISRPVGKPALYKRQRVCDVEPMLPPGKPAIVLDIDETSLSNYSFMVPTLFVDAGAGVLLGTLAANTPALKPVLDLYRYARANEIAVFFITGRPSAVNSFTESNLKAAGYNQGWDALMNKTGDKGTLAFKSGARADIEKKGYTIVANVGDQESDLGGGHAEKAFKIPNPFYFISD